MTMSNLESEILSKDCNDFRSPTTGSRFNVLDRTESVHRHLLLEASAGTGKTFAIENIVVRLLIESPENRDPLLLENILVVTFTRAAARELKERIHSNLENTLNFFKKNLEGEEPGNHFHDYLAAHVEMGNEAVLRAKKLIERALFSFDRAQIFTIHGFCWRMLKNYSIQAGISLEASSREDQSLSITQMMLVVRDFLAKELIPSLYSPQQLKIIMQRANGKSAKLQQDLLNQINRGIDIEASPPFFELVASFQKAMKNIKKTYGFESSRIIEDFLILVPSYKELSDRNKQVHPEKMAKVTRFAALFDQQEWNDNDLDCLIEDGLFILEALDPSLLKAKAKQWGEHSLYYPNFLIVIKEQLGPLVLQARNEASIFSLLSSNCQKFVRRYQEQAEVFGHTDLLIQMKKAVGRPEFAACVRNDYCAAIVDEFQDTDPVQWEIFSLLFAPYDNSWKGYLNLVGDPKQSIYAFRQADIYTYLTAAERLGADAFATLETNFRSQSSLIEALNILFSCAKEPFLLPKKSQSLPYRNVNVGRKDTIQSDANEPSLHFWKIKNESKQKDSLKTIEKDFLFPTIANQILLLNQQKGLRFSQFAILIADRYQGARLCDYLKELEIPVKSQKGTDLSFSSAVDEMRDLLNGILNFQFKSSLNIALAGRLIGMTHLELIQLENEELLFPIVRQFHQLRNIFIDGGFAKFYSTFMKTSWHNHGKNVLENLLNQSNGAVFYREWQDLADLIIHEAHSESLSPQRIIAFLDNLEKLSCNEEDKIKAYVDFDEEGVSVLTMHMSKGLEFDIVFPLGLIKRTKQSEDVLIPINIDTPLDEKKIKLCHIENKEDPRFLKYCEENDAEKMRQLYVALTRAKERLYVPVVIDENQKEISFGCASPIDLLLAKLDRTTLSYAGLYQRISIENGSSLENLAAKFPTKIGLSQLTKQSEPFLTKKKVVASPVLIPPKEIKISRELQLLQSFTSLSHTNSPPSIIMEQPFIENILMVPHDFSCEEKTEHTLPSGNETGVMLHKIFEHISFDSVRELKSYDQLRPLIFPFLKGTPFALWEDPVAKIVFNVLKTPLDKNSGFCLADVDRKKIYRETEFFYPCDPNCEMFNNVSVKPGYLKGIADVFFEHQGKFYLLDWKSNWLGPTLDSYYYRNIREAMRINQYDLQAAIYCEAFQRYLKIFNKLSHEEVFGGIFYVFVRGVSSNTGIIHFSPKAAF